MLMLSQRDLDELTVKSDQKWKNGNINSHKHCFPNKF